MGAAMLVCSLLLSGVCSVAGVAKLVDNLGVTKTEQVRTNGWLLATDPLFLGGVPTRANADARLVASLRKAAAALEAFSKKAARDPLHTGS